LKIVRKCIKKCFSWFLPHLDYLSCSITPIITLKNTEGPIKMDNPEKLATYGTQDEDTKQKHNHSCKCVLSVRMQFRREVIGTTLWDNVCQWLAAGRCFSQGTRVFSNNKTDRHDITDILLKLALKTATLTPWVSFSYLHTTFQNTQANSHR
jgi:hypothetical protein